MRPLRLRSDNFTPASRTPWGGRRILALKRGLAVAEDKAGYPVVGESWEMSVDPAFPSRVEDGRPLAEALPEAAATPMLVKLLDAADDLSVQVHPPDHWAGLQPGQSGKPECWIVLDCAPGAGIYLGLREGVTHDALRDCVLDPTGDVASLLNFVPVTVGDCFVLGPGTLHAVGAGVMLAEPQLVRPGMTGTTYRLWDWNRRYDALGRRDPAGQPRALHVQEGLAVTRFDGPRGAALVAAKRRVPCPKVTLQRGGYDHLCELGHMAVERLTGDGDVDLVPEGRLGAVVVVSGEVTLGTPDATVALRAGQSAAIPGACAAVPATFSGALAIVTWCPA